MTRYQIQELVIKSITNLMELTEHQRKTDYFAERRAAGQSVNLQGDKELWSKGDYQDYKNIEEARNQALLGQLELASYTTSLVAKDIKDVLVPDVTTVDIRRLIDIQTKYKEINTTFDILKLRFITGITPMYTALGMVVDPDKAFEELNQLSKVIEMLSKARTNEYGELKAYHVYGTDVLNFDAPISISDTIISGYDHESWLQYIMNQQRDNPKEEVHISIYNRKDVIDEDYEFFLIAATYMNTLVIISDEIKHANIWARLACRARNNRRHEDRFENVYLPYHSVREKGSTAVSRIHRVSGGTREQLIENTLAKLEEMGFCEVVMNKMTNQRGNKEEITIYSEHGRTLAISTSLNGTGNQSTIYADAQGISDAVAIKDLNDPEKSFILLLAQGIRSILTAANGDFSEWNQTEFASSKLMLTAGIESKELDTFDSMQYDDISEVNQEYIKRLLKFAKDIRDSDMNTKSEKLELYKGNNELMGRTDTSIRKYESIDEVRPMFQAIMKTGTLEKHSQWIVLEKEREYIQESYNMLRDYWEERDRCGSFTKRQFEAVLDIGKFINDHRENVLKYLVNIGKTMAQSNEDTANEYYIKSDSFGYDNYAGKAKYMGKIAEFCRFKKDAKKLEMLTWQSDYLITGEGHNYYTDRKIRERYWRTIDMPTFINDSGDREEMNYTSFRVTFYTAEQIAEACGVAVSDLPLTWRMFYHNHRQNHYFGNSNLHSVHPLSRLDIPEYLEKKLKIGFVTTRKEYDKLFKNDGALWSPLEHEEDAD